MEKPVVLGIDLGSREVKMILADATGVLRREKTSTMNFYKTYCEYHDKLRFSPEKWLGVKPAKCISTGYGRLNIELEHFEPIIEIKAHVLGSIWQTGERNFTLLDIGGQDVKGIQVSSGRVTEIELNDKCAASCGRYLENMAKILEISVETLSRFKENPAQLNSTCAVFSESELIGRIAEGVGLPELCAGVNYSMYKRLEPILHKLKKEHLVVSGGVAYNDALMSWLEPLYTKVTRVEEPQYNGALGCCYYGLKKLGIDL